MTSLTTLPSSTGAVIVGGGPTGLAVACMLAKERVPFVLVDKLGEGQGTSRAAVVHARTLEVLEEIGVSSRMKAAGHVVPQFTLRDRDRVLAKIRFDALLTTYPHTLMLPQCDTERILSERLSQLGGSVLRPVEVDAVTQDGDGASVSVSGRTIRARYVVGADGMHSKVRESAGIGFTGRPYEESFVLADVRMTWPLSRDQVLLFVSPDGLVVIAPLPGDRYRIVATLDDAPEHPDVSDVQRLLETRGPRTGTIRVEEMIWSSRFRVHHRLADRYRAGRIVLAGDAAHVHSPAGGQGMNTGIQDGIALGRALADVLAGSSDESALDRYAAVRRPIAERVVGFTDGMTRMATLRAAPARALRNAALGILGHVPAFRTRLANELSGLRNR